jgi:hypothetical protein
MKLKCRTHDNRVMVVGPFNSVLHRQDGSNCSDLILELGEALVDTRNPGALYVQDPRPNHPVRIITIDTNN